MPTAWMHRDDDARHELLDAACGPLARTSAVLPVLDEATTVAGVVAGLLAEGVGEVVVVDGGSRDGTATQAAAAGARVLVEPRQGYGRACARGADAATGEILLFLDGDGSDSPALAASVVAPVAAGAAGLSLARRRPVGRGVLLPHQALGNRLVARVLRLRHGVVVSDIPPMRAIRRDALATLGMAQMTYGWPTEMIVRAQRAGLVIVEVDAPTRARQAGSSKVAGRLGPSFCAGARMLAVAARRP